jgi:hypothetical protein
VLLAFFFLEIIHADPFCFVLIERFISFLFDGHVLAFLHDKKPATHILTLAYIFLSLLWLPVCCVSYLHKNHVCREKHFSTKP